MKFEYATQIFSDTVGVALLVLKHIGIIASETKQYLLKICTPFLIK